MAIAYVSGQVNTPDSSSGTSISSPALNVTSGRLIVVAVYGYDPTFSGLTVTGISDTAGNTYHQAASYASDPALCQDIWYAYNVTGNANNVVSVTFNRACVYKICAQHQYSGARTTSPLDTSNNGTNGSGTSMSTGATTSNYDNSMMLAFYTISAIPTFTAGSGFTNRLNALLGQTEDDEDLGGSGSYGSTMTSGTSAAWCGIHSIFRQADAASSTPILKRRLNVLLRLCLSAITSLFGRLLK